MAAPPATTPRRLLLAGLPRSGSTWVAQALSHCERASLVHEPDNDRHHVHALAAKADLGRYPLLRPGDRAPAYARLFGAALTDADDTGVAARRRAAALRVVERGDPTAVDDVMAHPGAPWPAPLRLARALSTAPRPGRPVAGTRIVKTVHAALALDWLLTEVPTDVAAVTVRHPANVIGSWRELGWSLRQLPWDDPRLWEGHEPPGGALPGPGGPEPFAFRAAWAFALLADALVRAADRHGLVVVDHEELLADPPARLEALAARLGLRWTEAAAEHVRAGDREGEGYELQRRAAAERGRWRTRLDRAEARTVAEVVRRFPTLVDRWDLGPA